MHAMLATGIYPDFITLDGSEGGTGAAPPEFSNSLGMPLVEGLVFVNQMLIGAGLREHIKIIASGKVLSSPLLCPSSSTHTHTHTHTHTQRIQTCTHTKVLSGFSLVRNLALGADACNSARAMMFALGCIQVVVGFCVLECFLVCIGRGACVHLVNPNRLILALTHCFMPTDAGAQM